MRFAAGRSTLETVDFYLGYCLMAIGLCLIAGLFTRLAAFGGGVFLLSVVAAQPFWIPDAVGMWKESIEMVALFTLSATPVGRWAGLDFLIHGLCMRCCQAKGSSDASNS
jgi:uncharacterized membrane protein YphA (DoxX/SURF4 family)